MCLKDKLKYSGEESRAGGGKPTKIHKPCRRYNKGKCTYGASCRYEHHCSVKRCGKFRHGAHICHLRDNNGQSQTQTHTPGGRGAVANEEGGK